MSLIQWYPGHMAKAKREITENLKLVDIVIELRDARIPFSSKNPMIESIIGKKPRLILLCKSSMADPKVTSLWIDYYKRNNIIALDVDSITGYNMNKIIGACRLVLHDELERRTSRFIINNQIKGIILGIPNVGKSTLINVLGKRKSLKTGNRPGVTKSQTWLKVNDELLLLDTPGILWPKFEDQLVGAKLAMCGTIKDEILDPELMAYDAVGLVKKLYPELLKQRYEIDADNTNEGIIEEIGKKRGALLKGGRVDMQKASVIFITDLRNNRLGVMSYERPES